jgi:hypothetical protein
LAISGLLIFILLLIHNVAYAAQVTLTWDPNTESTLKGYKIYYGPTSGGSYTSSVDVGNKATCTVSNLDSSKTYYFVATAYDASGNESGYSNEVKYTNRAPVASNGTLSVAAGASASGTLKATDADGDALTYSIVSKGTKGSATISSASTGAFTYKANAGASGTDTFTFRASDGKANSNTATVTVTISGSGSGNGSGNGSTTNRAPVASNGTLSVAAGASASGTLKATDADADALTYSIVSKGTKGSATISSASTGAFTYKPNAGTSGTDTFTFRASDGKANSNTATVTVTIKELEGAPLFRVNAGGSAIAAPDGSSPSWGQDKSSAYSQYVNASSAGNQTAGVTSAIVPDPSVPLSVPSALFQTERWDPSSGAEMQWNFPVDTGSYEVRLYFAETYTGITWSGQRVFDVSIEGINVLEDYDIFDDAGGRNIGVMKSFVTTVTDGNLTIDFRHVVENPSIKGIEILTAPDGTPDDTGGSGIFTTQTPTAYGNDLSYELGTKFRADVNGQITQVRLYAPAQEGGNHTVRIWRVSDKKLVAGPYTWNISSGTAGWKSFTLPTPLQIAANTDYIVSVTNSSDLYYAAANHGFDASIVNGHLHTYVGSGVYTRTLGSMPTSTWANSNYFRDVIFVPED